VTGEPSLVWIDWRLAPGAVLRDSLWRLFFLTLAAFALIVLLLSGAADRFLASRYAITAVLRTPLAAGEGEGFARKVAGLPPVRAAVYKDPEASWKEFLLAFPGLDSLRSGAGNPLPGYIEVRLRPDRLTTADIDQVTSALRNVPYVERVLAGGEQLPRMLRLKRWAAVLAWGVFGSFAGLFSLLFLLQERVRGIALAGNIAFLAERGVPTGRMAASRAAGAALSAIFLASGGAVLSAVILRYLLLRYPALEHLVGPPAELLSPRIAAAVAGFLLCAALLASVSSLIGFRAARATRK